MSITVEIKKLRIQTIFKNALEKEREDAECNLTGLQVFTKQLLTDNVQKQDQVMSKESRSSVSVYGQLSVVFNKGCTVKKWHEMALALEDTKILCPQNQLVE